MKKLILFLSFITLTSVNAQKIDYKVKPKEIVAENNVFEVSGKTATELYQLTTKWISSKYKNPSKVIGFNNENTNIGVKHFFDINTQYTSPNRIKVKYNMQFDFKDEKVRITFTDIEDTYYTKYSDFFNKNGALKEYQYVQKSVEILEDYVSKYVEDYLSYLKTGNDW